MEIAIQNGDLKTIKSLIEKGADIHANNNYLLRYASNNGYLEIIEFLIEKEVNIDIDYVLNLASQNGHMDIVKFLIEKGADIHANNDYILNLASKNGQLEVVKFLIEKGADINSLNDQDILLKLLNSKLIEYIINNINIRNNINYYLNKITENKDYFISYYYYYKLNKKLSYEFKKELINKRNILKYN